MSNLIKNDNFEPLYFLFTCVKDGKNYISKLFESLLKQTYTNFIHFIYEDGSMEPLDELVDNYKEKVEKLEKPFKVIYIKNTLNKGLNLSTQYCLNNNSCKYFLWINCDDWIDYRFFEIANNFIKKHPGYAMYRSSIRFVNNDRIIQKRMSSNKTIIKDFFLGNYDYSTTIFSTEKFKLINKDNHLEKNRNFPNDVQVVFSNIFYEKSNIIIDNCYSYYLIRENTETKSINRLTPDLLQEYLASLIPHLFLSEKDIDIVKIFSIQIKISKKLHNKEYKDCIRLIKQKRLLIKKHKIKSKLCSKGCPDFLKKIYCYLKLYST